MPPQSSRNSTGRGARARRLSPASDSAVQRVAEAKRPEGPYGPASGPISKDWVEGPSVLKTGDSWIVFYDEYREKRYGAIRSRDLVTWETIAVSFPPGTRHGTAFSVLR